MSKLTISLWLYFSATMASTTTRYLKGTICRNPLVRTAHSRFSYQTILVPPPFPLGTNQSNRHSISPVKFLSFYSILLSNQPQTTLPPLDLFQVPLLKGQPSRSLTPPKSSCLLCVLSLVKRSPLLTTSIDSNLKVDGLTCLTCRCTWIQYRLYNTYA